MKNFLFGYLLAGLGDSAAKTVYLSFGLVALGLVLLSGSANEKASEKGECLAAFAETGLSERDVMDASDRQVVEVCGKLPKYPLNKLWRREDRPRGHEHWLSCRAAFVDAGLKEDDVYKASDEQLVRLCETVPDMVD